MTKNTSSVWPIWNWSLLNSLPIMGKSPNRGTLCTCSDSLFSNSPPITKVVPSSCRSRLRPTGLHSSSVRLSTRMPLVQSKVETSGFSFTSMEPSSRTMGRISSLTPYSFQRICSPHPSAPPQDPPPERKEASLPLRVRRLGAANSLALPASTSAPARFRWAAASQWIRRSSVLRRGLYPDQYSLSSDPCEPQFLQIATAGLDHPHLDQHLVWSCHSDEVHNFFAEGTRPVPPAPAGFGL